MTPWVAIRGASPRPLRPSFASPGVGLGGTEQPRPDERPTERVSTPAALSHLIGRHTGFRVGVMVGPRPGGVGLVVSAP